MKTDQLVSLGHLARRLGIPPQWLREEAEAGRLPCARTGSGFVFDAEVVERVLLERARRMPEAEAGRGRR
jgi:hypothetical protein